MCIATMSSSCRVCMRIHPEADGLNLFRKSNKNITTLARLNKIVGLVLKQRKNMPDYICADCVMRLTEAFEFRLQCRRSQALLYRPAKTKLRQSLKNVGKKACAGKESEKHLNTNVKDVRHDSNQTQDGKISETQKISIFETVKLEPDYFTDDDTQSKLEAPKQTVRPNDKVEEQVAPFTAKTDELSILTKAIKKDSKPNRDDNDGSPDSNNQSSNQYAEEPCSLITDDIKVTSAKSEESDRHSDSSEVWKIGNASKQTKSDIRNGEKPARFICEMCGQTFNVQHYFNSHVNRHKGEQTFACEICPEKYYSQQSLKRHMLKHAGAQPNACRYCPRRFLDCSAKVRHERMHTNNRPYKCTYCEKAFTSNYVLKNHVLTHTGERPFSCRICQRSFTQKKHLSAHYKSTTHKLNEEKVNAIDVQEIKGS